MPIDFPNSPTNGDQFTNSGRTWQYDGSAWNLVISTVSLPANAVDTPQIVNNAVTSAKILDGTIVNADINASAGIDKTKIAGTAVTVADTGTVTSTMIADGTIVNGDINASAAIALTKLASGTSAQVVLGNASGVPTYTTVTGDVTISNTGVTAIGSSKVTSAMIVDGTIVNADISATAAINTTKITNWEDDQVVLSQQVFG